MKKVLFCLITVLFSSVVFAQENKELVSRLEERYPGYSVCYHDGYGGYYSVANSETWGACDLNGKEIIAPGKYSLVTLHDGYYGVKIGDKRGACDLNGKEVVPCKYESVVYSGGEFMARNNEHESFFVLNDVELPAKETNPNRTITIVSSAASPSATAQENQQEKAARLLALGKEYEKKKDMVNAAKYYEEAALLDNAEAQCCIAIMYSSGNGVEKNPVKSEAWLKLSAMNGNSSAQCVLAMSLELDGMYGDALYWFRQAASQGDSFAQKRLAALQNGIGSNSGQTIPSNQGNFNNQQNKDQRVKTVCPYCNGTGRKCQLKTVPTYGNSSKVRHRCNNCQELLSVGLTHVQVRCPHCQGTGYK